MFHGWFQDGKFTTKTPCTLLQIEVCSAIYKQSASGRTFNEENSPLVVGHNVYILAYQLAQYKKELKAALDKATRQADAVGYYARNTAQIEVGVVCLCVC